MGGKSRRIKRNKNSTHKHVNFKRKRVKLKNILNKQAITAKILAKRKRKQLQAIELAISQAKEE